MNENHIPKSLKSINWIDSKEKFNWFDENQVMPVLVALYPKNMRDGWTFEVLSGIISWQRATYSFVISYNGDDPVLWPMENCAFYHVIKRI